MKRCIFSQCVFVLSVSLHFSLLTFLSFFSFPSACSGAQTFFFHARFPFPEDSPCELLECRTGISLNVKQKHYWERYNTHLDSGLFVSICYKTIILFHEVFEWKYCCFCKFTLCWIIGIVRHRFQLGFSSRYHALNGSVHGVVPSL